MQLLNMNEFRDSLSIVFEKIKKANSAGQDLSLHTEFAKEIISICLPSAKYLFSKPSRLKFWTKYNKRVQDILAQQVDINKSIYYLDYVFAFANEKLTEEQGESIYKLLAAFDNVVGMSLGLINLSIELSQKFKNKFEKKIVETITDGPRMADDSCNSAFKNHLNEITFFYYMATHSSIKLVEIEKSMPNGKKADFHLVWNNTDYFVDTITVQNTKGQEDINRFVKGKIKEKYELKTSNLKDENILKYFRVLPILEFVDDRLIDYEPILSNDQCLPPVLSLIEERQGIFYLSLETLPLGEDVKKQLLNRLYNRYRG